LGSLDVFTLFTFTFNLIPAVEVNVKYPQSSLASVSHLKNCKRYGLALLRHCPDS